MNPNLSDGMKAFLEDGARGGGLVSDGPVPDTFDSGWALHPIMLAGKAHWWVLYGTSWTPKHGEVAGYLSACGLRQYTTKRAPLLLPGNWTTCER